MTKRVPTHKLTYRWHTIRCRHCGRRHETERPNTKFCSEACSKAYRRDLAERREEAALMATSKGDRMPGQMVPAVRVPNARTASSGIEAYSQSPEVHFQADLLLSVASVKGAEEVWRLTPASDKTAYEIQRHRGGRWTTMARTTSPEVALHKLALDGHDVGWCCEDVWVFVEDNPLTPADDGLRWRDRYGFIHRAPAGTRSQLPSTR